jgi:hypothetical protein
MRVLLCVVKRLAECDLVSILRKTEQHGAVWISMTVACAATVALRPVAAKRLSHAPRLARLHILDREPGYRDDGATRAKQASCGHGRRLHRAPTRRDAMSEHHYGMIKHRSGARRSRRPIATTRHSLDAFAERKKRPRRKAGVEVVRTAMYQSIAIRARSSDAATRWRRRPNHRGR